MLLADLAEVSPDKLDDLGIEVPAGLADATIGLWRRSTQAKWHWVDQRARCKHVPGYQMFGPNRCDVEPDEQIPALGFAMNRSSMCVGCSDSITLSAPAEAFVTVVAELLRAQDWLQEGQEAAAQRTWSWMAFACWKTRAPLAGKTWDLTLRQVRGKGWAAPASVLRGLIADFHNDAAIVTRACINSIAENPALTSQVERAMRMVETDTPVREESELILRISGCPGKTDSLFGAAARYSQDPPWGVVAQAWRSYHAEHDKPAMLEALCSVLDREFPHVHDIFALDCTEDMPQPAPGDCLHSWAWRSAAAHRRGVVAQWLSRLNLALDGISSADQDPAADCTHLVAVPFWPPTYDGMEALAYLAQFDIVAGPFKLHRNYFGAPSVVVLRIPEWSAAHLETLPRRLPTVVIDNEAVQAVQLARAEGIPVVAGEFRGRRKPSQQVAQCRTDMDCDPFSAYEQRRPLAAGAQPPPLYYGQRDPETEWTSRSVQRAFGRGTEFVYGADDLELLRLGWTNSRWCPSVTLTVELLTECQYHDEPGPHICEVDGHISAIGPDGSLEFTPQELADPVTIPAAYIAAVKFN